MEGGLYLTTMSCVALKFCKSILKFDKGLVFTITLSPLSQELSKELDKEREGRWKAEQVRL